MKNVKKSLVQGSVRKIGHGLANHIGVFALGAAFLLAPLGATTAKADSAPALTHLQYVQQIAQLSGASGQFTSSSKAGDYFNWAQARGLNPKDGWKSDATLTKDALAQTLVQLFGLPGKQSDAAKTLDRNGISISDVGDKVTQADLVGLVDQFGFAIRLALPANGPKNGTPTDRPTTPPKKHSDEDGKDKPPTDNHKVTLCHKGHTIKVDEHSVAKHLAHGDTLGPCHVTKHSHDRDDDDHHSDDHH